MAKALYGAGLRQGDAIAIMCENRHELIGICFGALMLNATIAPINPSYNERKLRLLSSHFHYLILSVLCFYLLMIRRTQACTWIIKAEVCVHRQQLFAESE